MGTEQISADLIAKARAELERRWDEEGACQSCGWHAALYEHRVTDEDLADAIRNGGLLMLSCLSEDDDPEMHRGVRIKLEK